MARWHDNDVKVWKTILSSVAPSTKSSYEKIFFRFVQFFEERGFDFATLNVDETLQFLQSFVGKSKSRVRTGVAAIKFFLKIYHREDLVVHPLITLFGKGAQNLAPLPREKTQIWNPQVVLDWLKTRPIPSAFLDCAKEACLLLLLATGWRVDDVWKLDCRVEWFEDSARFFFCVRRKCPVKGSFTTSQMVGRFSSEPGVCPIDAVFRFMQVARKIRKVPCSVLFVSSTGNPASKDTLRRWVVDLLAKANVFDSAGSCRSASTSAALARNRSIDDILNLAGWSSVNTFRRFYQREVLPSVAPLNLMLSE